MDYIKTFFENKNNVICVVCLIISLFLFNMLRENFDTSLIPTKQNYINQLENTCMINNSHTNMKNKIYWIGNFYGYNCIVNDNKISYNLGNVDNTKVTLNLDDYKIDDSYYIGYTDEGNLMTPASTKNHIINNGDKLLNKTQNTCSIFQQSNGLNTFPLHIKYTNDKKKSCFNCYVNQIGNPESDNFGGILNASCVADDGSILLNHTKFNNTHKDSDNNYVLNNNNGVLQPITMNY